MGNRLLEAGWGRSEEINQWWQRLKLRMFKETVTAFQFPMKRHVYMLCFWILVNWVGTGRSRNSILWLFRRYWMTQSLFDPTHYGKTVACHFSFSRPFLPAVWHFNRDWIAGVTNWMADKTHTDIKPEGEIKKAQEYKLIRRQVNRHRKKQTDRHLYSYDLQKMNN